MSYPVSHWHGAPPAQETRVRHHRTSGHVDMGADLQVLVKWTELRAQERKKAGKQENAESLRRAREQETY